MLQPDLFFSYGLASGLTMAAGKKLIKAENPWVTKYFLAIIIWLAVFFIPQVIYLLWKFPGWESMFTAATYEDLPAWLVSLYPVAVIVLGVLGFYVTYRFLKKGKVAAAALQAVWSMAAATFIVFIGWDGTGYKRLLYSGTGAEWARGVSYPFTDFFSSQVFYTLLWLEALVLIPYVILFIRWAREGELIIPAKRART